MKEIICINVGQGGIQISNAAWELLCVEHGITADGKLNDNSTGNENHGIGTFFHLNQVDKCIPRVVTVDLEPTVIDEIRTGHYRDLFHPDTLISGDEDAASNFARGHFTKGKNMIESTLLEIKKVANNCEKFEGFLFVSSHGGGTGSGFQALILERLSIEYTKKLKMSVVIFPSETLATSTVEPYNALLTTHLSSEHGDMSVFIDNESLYNICLRTLDISRPTYSNINRIIAQAYSSMTVSLRFQGLLNANLDQMLTNLIPYPRIHYETLNYSPIISVQRAIHEKLSTQELTRDLFESSSQLLNVVLNDGKYISCCLQYRGDVTPKDVNEAIFEIKKRTYVKFVDWCPTGFKIGISSQPPATIPESGVSSLERSVTMVSNTTSIVQLFERTNRMFDALYAKRSFVHWFVGEGLEEGEFTEATDSINYLIKDYKELEMDLDDIPLDIVKEMVPEDPIENYIDPEIAAFQKEDVLDNENTDTYLA